MSHDGWAAASVEQLAVRKDLLSVLIGLSRGAECGQWVRLYKALGGGWPVDIAPQANLNMPASPEKE